VRSWRFTRLLRRGEGPESGKQRVKEWDNMWHLFRSSPDEKKSSVISIDVPCGRTVDRWDSSIADWVETSIHFILGKRTIRQLSSNEVPMWNDSIKVRLSKTPKCNTKGRWLRPVSFHTSPNEQIHWNRSMTISRGSTLICKETRETAVWSSTGDGSDCVIDDCSLCPVIGTCAEMDELHWSRTEKARKEDVWDRDCRFDVDPATEACEIQPETREELNEGNWSSGGRSWSWARARARARARTISGIKETEQGNEDEYQIDGLEQIRRKINSDLYPKVEWM
jgi:hypothetical protein